MQKLKRKRKEIIDAKLNFSKLNVFRKGGHAEIISTGPREAYTLIRSWNPHCNQ
jgi:hypothetical protein